MLTGVSGYLYNQNPYYTGALAAQRAGGVAAAGRTPAPSAVLPPAQPDVPVQPVDPVRPVPQAASVQDEADLVRRWQSDPAALAGRSRMEFLSPEALQKMQDAGPASNASTQAKAAYSAAQAVGRQLAGAESLKGAGGLKGALQKAESTQGPEEAKSAREVMEEAECQTCKERKYQDGSDDPGVSFKTASHIDPELAASKVRGHEMEHVVREQAKALREDREVVSQSVSYQTAICPECGRAYVSGGTTRTTTAASSEPLTERIGGKEDAGGFSVLV